MTADLYSCYAAKEDFNSLINKLHPFVLSSFITWLDRRVAEFKVFGRLLNESEQNTAKTYILGKPEGGTSNSYSAEGSTSNSYSEVDTPSQTQTPFKDPLQSSILYGTSFSPLLTPNKTQNGSSQTSIQRLEQYHHSIINHHDQNDRFQMFITPTTNAGTMESFNINEARGSIEGRGHSQKQDNSSECINLESDDEDLDNREPVDQKPECGLLMEVMDDVQREVTPEPQPTGTVSVIKLELPEKEEDQNNSKLPRIPDDRKLSWEGTSLNTNEIPNFDNSTSGNNIGYMNGKNLSNCENGELDIPNYVVIEMSDNHDNTDLIQNALFEKLSFPGKDLKMCHICLNLFGTDQELENHFQTSHPGIMVLSTCIYCGKGFSDQGTMHRHLLSDHLQGKSATCVICGKTFTQLQHFKGHLNTHRGVHAHKCKSCKRVFTYKTHLTVHERQCGGLEGNFKCNICDRQFLMRTHLREHIRGMHAKKPRYSCTFCNAKFDWRGSCIRHKKKCQKNPENFNVTSLYGKIVK